MINPMSCPVYEDCCGVFFCLFFFSFQVLISLSIPKINHFKSNTSIIKQPRINFDKYHDVICCCFRLIVSSLYILKLTLYKSQIYLDKSLRANFMKNIMRTYLQIIYLISLLYRICCLILNFEPF